jgi:hypothetical protein
MFQDDHGMFADPVATLQRMRLLGVETVRLSVRWSTIAPRPNSRRRPQRFNANDPAAYPAANWGSYDQIVRDAEAAGITVNFDLVGGAPDWATGPGAPKTEDLSVWEPSAREFGYFVHAVAVRYSGNYDPTTHESTPGDPDALPRVRFWSIWNEPDYGPSLAPQGLLGDLKIEHSPQMYRGLVGAAWTALHQTGHAGDTILFGELAPRGFPTAEKPKASWGVFSGMKPLTFLRSLYCVDVRYQPLRGTAASLRGCPSSAAGSRRFRVRNPALFQASGFSVHPYSRWYSPDIEGEPDPDYTALAQIGNLTRALDKVNAVYHSGKRFPIWNTEYGYITSPPKHSPDPKSKAIYLPQATAAYYLNWAEYISYRNPRIQSFEQYLLNDPLPTLRSNNYGGFASGLLTYTGAQKATYGAWRLPIFVPVSKARSGQAIEVWGAARPAHFALLDSSLDVETVEIQFAPGTSTDYQTVKTITITDPRGYFDTHVVFPGSGTVRLAWTYPPDDPLLAPGYVTFSRQVKISAA